MINRMVCRTQSDYTTIELSIDEHNKKEQREKHKKVETSH